jgi:hypothetical protein
MIHIKPSKLKSYGLSKTEKEKVYRAILKGVPFFSMDHLVERIIGKEKVGRILLRVRHRYSNEEAKKVFIYLSKDGKTWDTTYTTIDGSPISTMIREQIIKFKEVYSSHSVFVDGKTDPMSEHIVANYTKYVKLSVCYKIAQKIVNFKTPDELKQFVNLDSTIVIDQIVKETILDPIFCKKMGIESMETFYNEYLSPWYENVFNRITDFKKVQKKKEILILEMTQKFTTMLIKIVPWVIVTYEKILVKKLKIILGKNKMKEEEITIYMEKFWYTKMKKHFIQYLGPQAESIYSLIADPIPDIPLPEVSYKVPTKVVNNFIGSFINDFGDENKIEEKNDDVDDDKEVNPENEIDINPYDNTAFRTEEPQTIEVQQDLENETDLSKIFKNVEPEYHQPIEPTIEDVREDEGDDKQVPLIVKKMKNKKKKEVKVSKHKTEQLTPVFGQPIQFQQPIKPMDEIKKLLQKTPVFEKEISQVEELVEYIMKNPDSSMLILVVSPKNNTMRMHVVHSEDIDDTEKNVMRFPLKTLHGSKENFIGGNVEMEFNGNNTDYLVMQNNRITMKKNLVKNDCGLYNVMIFTEK